MEQRDFKEAGCAPSAVTELMKLEQSEDRTKQLILLSQCRNAQLNKIHREQRKLDRLDFIIYKFNQHEAKK